MVKEEVEKIKSMNKSSINSSVSQIKEAVSGEEKKIKKEKVNKIPELMDLPGIGPAVAHKLEQLRRRGVIGGLLALTGIAIAVSGSLSTGVNISMPHIIAIFIGVACLAEGGIVRPQATYQGILSRLRQ